MLSGLSLGASPAKVTVPETAAEPAGSVTSASGGPALGSPGATPGSGSEGPPQPTMKAATQSTSDADGKTRVFSNIGLDSFRESLM